jgi:maltose alpha-D-glucosyltransferase/alpha-amylase
MLIVAYAEIAQSIAVRFPEMEAAAVAAAHEWRRLSEAAFLTAYEEAAAKTRAWVGAEPDRQRLLRFHLLTRALYEVLYEARNRPEWIATPVRGVLEILDAKV